MNARRHIVVTTILLIFAALLVGILWKGLTLNPNVVQSSQLGRDAKSFSLVWLQGKEFAPDPKQPRIRLQDFLGKPLIVNFWASWCVSCRQEAQELQAFWTRHQHDGIGLVGIAIQDTPEEALDFAKRHGKTYILGLDDDGKAAIEYGVSGVPETFLIGRDGLIKHKEVGPVTAELLESLLPKIQ